MFESLTSGLGAVFDRLRQRGTLTEADVDGALTEIRRALLEADVALPVVSDFVEQVRTRAIGQEILSSISPGQMVVKVVHDQLVDMLGSSEPEPLKIASPPAFILMVGLQGSGKTTTTAKLAKHIASQTRKKLMLASLDNRRPAAMEQLATLGERAGIDTLEIVPEEDALAIARRAKEQATRRGYEVILLDTAGRMAIDEELMAEMIAIRDLIRPREIILVADSLTGQDAVRVAEGFQAAVELTGIILTRLDGDNRGGAALAMRATTGRPIRFAGVGEGLDDLEVFHPDRMASRIVGQGDILSLVEKAQDQASAADTERMQKRLDKGRFDLNDLMKQFQALTKMGGISSVMGMLPGVGQAAAKLPAAMQDESVLTRQIAVIQSMTPRERRQPELLQATRKRRVAAGAGVDVEDVNRLLVMHKQFQNVVRKMAKSGKSIPDDPLRAQAAFAQMMAGGGTRLKTKRRMARR